MRASPAAALLAGCTVAVPPPGFLSDAALCDMPAEVRALGGVARLGPAEMIGPGFRCAWTPAVDLHRVGIVGRDGYCEADSGRMAARFLLSVTEGAVRVDSDHPLLPRLAFSACPDPEAGTAPPIAPPPRDSGLTGVDAPPPPP